MLTNAKALIVILGLALVTFHLCRPLCLRFMSVDAFVRRRNVWLALSIVAFLSPNFWIYAIFALCLLGWASARDENPLALYVFVTFTVPNVHFYIPVPGINQLFELTQYRILSLAVLIPAIMRAKPSSPANADARLGLAYVLLAAFLLLQVVLLFPLESITNTMRRTFLFALDTFLVFYAFSRLTSPERIAEVMASLWIGCAIMAPIAIFETVKGWLLYTGLAAEWGDPNIFAWLFRGDSLRAQAASGHSLNLGYHLAMALGIYLYIRRRGVRLVVDALIICGISLGIIVSYSRGAWVAAALVTVVFMALRPDGTRKFASTLLICAGVLALMFVTPLKEAVLDRLPFIGVTEQDSIEYRQRLAETSWLLIQQNPFFGDPFVYLRMETLRQGQGIIDIVNGYLFTALFTGLVGLSLQIGVFALSLTRSFLACMRLRQSGGDASFMGVSLVACFVGTLFYIAAAGYEPTTYILSALLLSYAAAMPRSAFPALHSLSASSEQRSAV